MKLKPTSRKRSRHFSTPTIKLSKNHKNTFEFEPNGEASLFAELIAPKQFNAKIEKNILTAPGKPGSVDKGEREERGVRLAISNKKPVKELTFVMRLKIRQ